MGIGWLAAIGVSEAVAYHYRYSRASTDQAMAAAISTIAVCGLRVAFVYVGASAVLADASLIAAAGLYVLPAAAATYAVHRWDRRRVTASKTSWGSDMSIQVDGHKIGCLCVACEATRGVVAAAVDWAASHHGRADRDAAADGDVDEALRVAVEKRAAAIRLPRREIPDPPAPPPPPEPDVTTKGG